MEIKMRSLVGSQSRILETHEGKSKSMHRHHLLAMWVLSIYSRPTSFHCWSPDFHAVLPTVSLLRGLYRVLSRLMGFHMSPRTCGSQYTCTKRSKSVSTDDPTAQDGVHTETMIEEHMVSFLNSRTVTAVRVCACVLSVIFIQLYATRVDHDSWFFYTMPMFPFAKPCDALPSWRGYPLPCAPQQQPPYDHIFTPPSLYYLLLQQGILRLKARAIGTFVFTLGMHQPTSHSSHYVRMEHPHFFHVLVSH